VKRECSSGIVATGIADKHKFLAVDWTGSWYD